MSTEVRVETSTSGAPVLRFTRRYPHPLPAVWDALTTDEALIAHYRETLASD